MSAPERPQAAELRRALREQGWAHLRVSGTSMRPAILPGEMIRIVPAAGVTRGDVVTFVREEVIVTHRVVAVTGDGIVCRGDDRYLADPPVVHAALIGRAVEVVGRRPLGGGRRALAVVDARRAAAHAGLMSRRLLQESGLLLGQACHRSPTPMVPTAAGIPSLPGEESWRVLQPEELLPAGGIAASDQEDAAAPLIVPAGVFSALDKARRRQLLACLRGRPALVCGLPLESAGRLVRVLGRVRRALARVGVRAGQPGDGVVHAVGGAPPGLAHYFSGASLTSELAEMGLEVSAAEFRASDWGMVVCSRTGSAIFTSDNTSCGSG